MIPSTIETSVLAKQDQQKPFDFELPAHLQANLPTEVRGLRRDAVRLMISYRHNNHITHTTFSNIGDFLREGDVLVVNTSGTRNSAVSAYRADGTPLQVHFSTQREDQRWVAEIRKIENQYSKRFHEIQTGEVLRLSQGGSLQLVAPYYTTALEGQKKHLRLWLLKASPDLRIEDYLLRYGFPIRYSALHTAPYPADYYQTVFARETGSAEMPSAGRAFTPELVTQLVAKGILIVPLLLHTGVSSLELDEKPYEEYYRVPRATADMLNLARKQERRIIAVGTTVIRALETTTARGNRSLPAGLRHYTQAGEGWTREFITPERGIFSVDGLLTGFHEPRASHLLMLEALVGKDHLSATYREALVHQYQWHEFGDLHLLLP